ncbi:Elongator subunit elp6 [Lobulomyces angularis]|nr:Elongator subunit elp6 [Lobulomyces angularis]
MDFLFSPSLTEPKLYHLSSTLEADGNFLPHLFTKIILKNNLNLIILGLKETESSFVALGRKLGSNVALMKSKGLFNFLEVKNELLDNNFAAIKLLITDKITKNIVDSTCIMIDNISIMLDLGVNLINTIDLIQFCQSNSKFQIIHTNADASLLENNTHFYLSQYLKHSSNNIITVQGLKTGMSQGVHGEIFFSPGCQILPTIDHSNQSSQKSVTKESAAVLLSQTFNLQYKVEDNNVLFFAKGLSNEVL